MSTSRILIDADACPVRAEAEAVAGRCGAQVVHFANATQKGDPGAQTVRVSDRRDATDFAIATACRPGDVVVTDDAGLAALALGRGAAALSSRGRRFCREEMAIRLEARHAARKARRAGRRTKGPRAMTKEDRQRFVRELLQLMTSEDGSSSSSSVVSVRAGEEGPRTADGRPQRQA